MCDLVRPIPLVLSNANFDKPNEHRSQVKNRSNRHVTITELLVKRAHGHLQCTKHIPSAENTKESVRHTHTHTHTTCAR
jgi:hypothetical protein